MIDLKAMTNEELLDHAFAHVMSGEYYSDTFECCDDARAEVLGRMAPSDPHPNRVQIALKSNVIKERSLAQVPPLLVNPHGCDSDVPASRDGNGGCRCIRCARCERHTGNQTQGHYWGRCKHTPDGESDFHFCCPGACEIEMRKEAG